MVDFKERENRRSTIHAWEMTMKWWRTSEEIIIGKCLMKVKCMGIGLNHCFWHKNGWEMKRNWMKIEESSSWFWKERICEKWRRKDKQLINIWIRLSGLPNRLSGCVPVSVQLQSRFSDLQNRLSGWIQRRAKVNLVIQIP